MRSEWIEKCFGKGAQVTISPDVVASESRTTFTIRITLGAGGLAKDDSVGLVCGSNIDRWQFQFTSHMWGQLVPWQTQDPTGANFITGACSRKDTAVKLAVGKSGGLKELQNQPDHLIRSFKRRHRYLLEISADRDLRKGDTLTLTWGDTTWNAPAVRAPGIALTYYFLPLRMSRLPRYDRGLPTRRGLYDQAPSIRVKGKEASRFHITCQPLVAKGECFDISVTAVDEYGNLAEEFSGTAGVKCDARSAKLPAKVTFKKGARGKAVIKGASLGKAGWAYVTVKGDGVEGRSHAILASEDTPPLRLYFGTMHGHTLDCDGLLTAREHYDYARDVSGLDFASCATHAEYFGGKEAWDAYLKAATQAQRPRKFVTFYGYEWAGEGHTNAYFLSEKDAQNIYGKCILRGKQPKDEPPFRIVCDGEERFIRMLENLEQPALAITHFHARYAGKGSDKVLRLHEVYSCHQQNTLEMKYRGILEKGLKIGSVSGSDSHRMPMGHLSGHPEAIWPQPLYINGLEGSKSLKRKCGCQGTLAPSLSRKTIWKAMYDRTTFGTSGARIVALMDVDGAMMGSEVAPAGGTRPNISVRVGGTAPLAEVAIVSYDGKVWSEPVVKKGMKGTTCDFAWRAPKVTGDVLYFVRVTQEDGELAWTSPVWITAD